MAIHRAAETGDWRVVETWKADTPLHIAAAGGFLHMIEKLLAAGADINVRNWRGFTPLTKSIVWGNFDVMKRLVAAGADIEVKDRKGRTPSDIAKHFKEEDVVAHLRGLRDSDPSRSFTKIARTSNDGSASMHDAVEEMYAL